MRLSYLPSRANGLEEWLSGCVAVVACAGSMWMPLVGSRIAALEPARLASAYGHWAECDPSGAGGAAGHVSATSRHTW